ncbi:MtnX-like HAD-IB family phosphatase [Chloroflexota bacterium]
MKNSKIAVLSDFDGTITTCNVLNSLYDKFATPSYRVTLERWNRGEISTMEEIETVFATVSASRAEMESFLDTVELDPGFPALLSYCRAMGIEFVVVSDGLRWYIDYIMRHHEIAEVAVYACDIHFERGNYRFSYPWFDSSTPMRSVSKSTIVCDYQSRGHKVVFIGDGVSDFEAVQVADIVYARDVLLEYTNGHDIQAQEFSNMGDLIGDLKILA